LARAPDLARRALSALLGDADPQAGSIAQQLGVLDEVSGLLAAARLATAGVLEERLASVQRSLGPHLRLVTGLPRADRWSEVRPGLSGAPARAGRRPGPRRRRHRRLARGRPLRRPGRASGAQRAHPGGARRGRRGAGGRHRRPGRALPPGAGAGRAGGALAGHPAAGGAQPGAAHAGLDPRGGGLDDQRVRGPRLAALPARGPGRGSSGAGAGRWPAATGCPRSTRSTRSR